MPAGSDEVLPGSWGPLQPLLLAEALGPWGPAPALQRKPPPALHQGMCNGLNRLPSKMLRETAAGLSHTRY